MASMVRRIIACVVVGSLALAFTIEANAQDKKDKKDEKKPLTVKEVMKKMNGKQGLVAKTAAAAKGEKWDDAVKAGKEAKEVGEALGKNEPKKGDKESWEKHTKTYAEVAKALFDGAEKKDAKGIEEAAGKFTKACMGCHSSHK